MAKPKLFDDNIKIEKPKGLKLPITGNGFTRAPEEMIKRLEVVSTATASALMYMLGIRYTFITGPRPLKTGQHAVGSALTMQFMPQREDIASGKVQEEGENTSALWAVLDDVQKNDFLMIQAYGDKHTGCLGEMLVTSFAGRGIAADSKLTLVAPIHEPETEAVLADADALVVFGSQLDGMNTKNWAIAWPKTIVLVDVEPTKTMRNVDPTAVVMNNNIDGVAAAFVSGTSTRSSWVDVASVNKTVRDRLRVGEKSKRGIALVEAIEKHWPADGTIVCDMSVCGYWTGVYAEQPRPRRIVYPVGWGTLGFGLPAAIGPAAVGQRTLAVCGDGGVAFALGELATIVQENLPYTLLIVDDGGYGMLRYDQQVMGHPERGVDLVSPDWAILAQSFGLSFAETTIEDLGDALDLKQPGIILIRETLYPPKSTSPRWGEK